MKTSKKLLLIIAGILIGILISTLILLRKDIKTLLAREILMEYKIVPSDKFVALDFSDNWIVTIKQGSNCKVELAVNENNNLHPVLENNDGTLYFTTDTTQEGNNSESIHAKITAPLLHVIKASDGTEILMKNFWSDSITIILSDSSKFSGKNNDFTNIIFKASDNEN